VDTVAGRLDQRCASGVFRAQDVEEAQLMRLNEQSKIVEATLMVRPLPAQTALMEALGPRLARRFGRSRAVAALLSIMVKPLVFLTRVGDKRGVSLVKPGSKH
jgi:hypothetical protein